MMNAETKSYSKNHACSAHYANGFKLYGQIHTIKLTNQKNHQHVKRLL